MSGEAIVYKASTAKTLESSGASISNNAVLAAGTAYDLVADGLSYPDAEFALTCSFATAPTEGSVISLYAQPLDVDGTADTQAPETTRPTYFVGNFVVNNVTGSQTLWLYGENLPLKASYTLHNNGTGQSISSGWTLKALGRTIGPAT